MGRIALHDYLRQIEGLLDDDRLEEAAAHCYSILQQQPRHVATYRLFGRALLEKQEYRHAIDIFQRVLSADPEDLFAHAGLAEAYRRSGDMPRSIWHMERAFEIEPYNRAVQLELRELYELRDGFAPEQVTLTRAALARIYVRGGHNRLAADELQVLLTDQPDRIDLRVLFAEALFWDDRRVEAAQVCAEIVDQLPDCITANAILADVWSSAGSESEARPFIDRLWTLTLLPAREHNPETLIGRAFSHADFAQLPEQTLVERLEFVPDTIQEPAVSPEPASVFPAVAVQELPGWLDELDDDSDENGVLPDIAESIDAETALLLQSEADGDAELQSKPGVSSVLGSEDAGEDGPTEPAETLVGEFKVAQEDMPGGEPEQPIEAFLPGEMPAEDSEEESMLPLMGEHDVENEGPSQDSTPAEPGYSPEDLFLESIVAEAFGEMEPVESPERESAELVWDDESPAAFDPQDDLSLEEIASEATEEEVATELPGDLAPESAPPRPEAVAPEPAVPPDVPIMEQTIPETVDEAPPGLPDDDGGPSTDLLFAALTARTVEDRLSDDAPEGTSAGEEEVREQRTQPEASVQAPELPAEEPGEWSELAPESPADAQYEELQPDDSFQTLPQEAPRSSMATPPADDATSRAGVAVGDEEAEAEIWLQEDGVEAESGESADDVVSPNPAEIVTKEFDGPPGVSREQGEPAALEADEAPEGSTAAWPESQPSEAPFGESVPSYEEPPHFESPTDDRVVDSSDIETAAAKPSDDLLDKGEARDIGDTADWLTDLGEDTDDIKDLPDWLYDAIGFTGELDMPDDYEEPEWLDELGGDKEETARQKQPPVSKDAAQQDASEAQNAGRDVAETPDIDRTNASDEQAIPDWLQDAGGSLEELPTDLAESLGISESDVDDEDEGALSWLEELAAEPASTEIENGVKNADAVDRLTKRPSSEPNEQADRD